MSQDRVEHAAEAIHGAAIRLLRSLRQVDNASGIPGAQLSALSVLVYAGPKTLGALAEAEQVKPPTMSQTVAQLEAQGLVTRRPLDRRSMLIAVTEKGRKLMEAGSRRRLALLTDALEGLPASKLAVLEEAALIMSAAATRKP
ncbi:MAG TPA: MarR family transcriptional regulator [Rhizomicrobium sp.]|nr:MarR family transcriptional regulator [Rhizomicrobium sp.]